MQSPLFVKQSYRWQHQNKPHLRRYRETCDKQDNCLLNQLFIIHNAGCHPKYMYLTC